MLYFDIKYIEESLFYSSYNNQTVVPETAVGSFMPFLVLSKTSAWRPSSQQIQPLQREPEPSRGEAQEHFAQAGVGLGRLPLPHGQACSAPAGGGPGMCTSKLGTSEGKQPHSTYAAVI